MKKLNPTYAELLNAHLKPFKAEIDGYRAKGIVFVENIDVFLLQNSAEGSTPCNDNWKNYGYKYSWCYKDGKYTTECVTNIYIEIEEDWKPKFGELVLFLKLKKIEFFYLKKMESSLVLVVERMKNLRIIIVLIFHSGKK